MSGARARCMGFAFGAGYQCALRALVPALDRTSIVSLCATERGGGHPRAIRATLRSAGDEWVMSGEKTFITLGEEAEKWLIAASRGQTDDGLNDIAIVAVEAGTAGTTIEPLPPLPIVPEISHAKLHLSNVAVAERQVLEGDGYQRYIKPFRTIEDIHVIAAMVGYSIALALRLGWDHSLVERLASAAVVLRQLAACEPSDPTTHIALAGTLSLLREIFADIDQALEETEGAPLREWRRDIPLLNVAQTARDKRRAAAWSTLRDV